MNNLIRDVPGFEGFYKVDDLGDIYSFVDNHGKKRATPYKLKANLDKGYYRIVLYKEGKEFKTSVGHIVCMAFHGPPASKQFYVIHLNRDLSDHRPENLKWVGTPKINKKIYDKLRWNEDPSINKHTKLTPEIVKEIVETLNKPDHPSLREMGLQYGVTKSHIANIKAGRMWKDITGGELYK